MIVNVLVPEIVRVAPEFIVRLLQYAAEPPPVLITGWLPPLGMTTVEEFVGMPPHQLDAVLQSVFVPPSQTQVPARQEEAPTVIMPVTEAK